MALAGAALGLLVGLAAGLFGLQALLSPVAAQTATTLVSNVGQGNDNPWDASEDRSQPFTTGGGPGGGGGGGGPSGPTPSELDFEWTVTHDLEQLDGGNDWPTGLWSDGENLWLLENGQGADGAVYAYDRASGERAAERVQRHWSARDRARRLGRGPFDSEELVLWNAGRRMGASHTVGRYGTFRHRGRRMRSPQRSRPPLRGVAAVALRSRARTAAVP